MTLKMFLLSVFAIGFPVASFAQADSRVVIIPSAVIAFQMPDKTYKSPYLENYLGGFGWGGSIAVFGEHKNFVFGGELNSARHSKQLTGRLSSSRVTFQETFASALFGYAGNQRTFQALGGPAVTLGTPTYDSGPRNPQGPNHWFALAGGVNWFLPPSHKMQLAIGARYYYVFKNGDEFTNIGLGRNAFRANIGVSFGSSI
jgi:hypothetical protein